ncbi:beta-catenin-like protein 1 isoform X2 [Varroa jacobsoni]|uniref:Beta-catenin-like protein 1 n=1 Tax=Varroa destructor TaxID=109461 RepID=A0A7M7JYM3_VARDE|nr:beta-catenin-like protein 1 [Varroa destructor]XP_022658967.1 beta-catenin-like protein 1 [Varroa destructor]XP_022658968.1 beta-catenin-like protein 1 [Varroa destructor]XP_022705422.1 beta-catenin-like protein 1 isoform X2 [Varroa jacobsoni]
MDVGELLDYKPDTEPRRDDEDISRPPKRFKDANGASTSSRAPEINADDLPDAELAPELTVQSLKKLILKFERQTLKNRELRIKFPDQPEKFMDSEIELNEVIQEMHIVATHPELYPILVQHNTLESLLSLLGHENSDIAIAAVDLLQEMTDVDTLNESEEGALALVDSLIEKRVAFQLVENMQRLNETIKEEADGVHHSLAVIEHIAEFRPEYAASAAQEGLMAFLLRRLRAKMPFDANKLYASEILAILLQNCEPNRKMLGEIEGIDILLQQLSHFRRHDPSNSEEFEMMENLFDVLCSALLLPANRDRFLKSEGLQLMNLLLKEKRQSRCGALKTLEYALQGPEGTENCNKFVDILGLRVLFPLLMHTPKKKKSRSYTPEEHEEHVISIICSLLKNCRSAQHERLLNKFIENEHEKVDRIMELHFKYSDKVRQAEREIEIEYMDSEEYSAEDIYLKKLERGLYTLQLIDYVIVDISAAGPESVKKKVLQVLNMRGGSVSQVRQIMREYAGNLGDGSENSSKAEHDRIMQLIDRF